MQGIPHPANFWTTNRPAGQFRAQHHLAHAAYDQALARQGIALPTEDLTAQVNRDWLARHDSRHQALRVIVGTAARQWINSSGLLGFWINSAHALGGWVGGFSVAATNAPTVDLASLDFTKPQAVRAWQQYHAQLHADIEQFLGMAFR